MASPNVTDIEMIVKNWAWNSFLKTRGKDHQKLKLDDISMTINWDRVRFNPGAPQYSDTTMVDQPNSKVVFTSTFENNTDTPQEHSFTTERTTVCTTTTCISKGYSQGFHLELKLGLPEEVAAATAGFGREVNVDTTEEQTKEQVITWAVNSTINVPEKRKTTARMEVKEKEFTGKFKVIVRIFGTVVVSILNLRENNCFVHACEGDISQILDNNKVKNGYHVEGGVVVWEVEGSSKFRFGVEQQVKIEEASL